MISHKSFVANSGNKYSELWLSETRSSVQAISKSIRLDICVVPDRGHRKSALRSDGSHWGSYLVVGRYGRGRAARSIRSGIVGIQSWRSVCSDATKPDRISGSTTLSRGLIRDRGSVRHCGYGAYSWASVSSKSASEIAVPAEKRWTNKKLGSSPKGRPSNFRVKTLASPEFGSRATMPHCYRVSV